MAYSISVGLAIYFVMWWIVLFVTLPFGIRSQHEGDEVIPGTEPGAPMKTMMARKLLWTTIISAIIFGIGFALYRSGYANVDRLSSWMGLPYGEGRRY